MATTTTHIQDLHREHGAWKAELLLAQDELQVMESRLQEVLTKNSDSSLHAKGESLQNQIFIHRGEVLKQLESIRVHEKELSAKAAAAPTVADHLRVPDHASERAAMETFGHLFRNLKLEVYKTLSPWM
jgi:hypothetical protein